MFHIISFKFFKRKIWCSIHPATSLYPRHFTLSQNLLYQTSNTSSTFICKLVFPHTDKALLCIGKESTHQAENCSAPTEQFHSHPALIFLRHGNLPLIKRGGVGQRIRLAHGVIPPKSWNGKGDSWCNARKALHTLSAIKMSSLSRFKGKTKRITIQYCCTADLKINAASLEWSFWCWCYWSWKLCSMYIFQ